MQISSKKRVNHFIVPFLIVLLLISSFTPTIFADAQELTNEKPTVTVIATGGTIGSLGTSRISYLSYGQSRIAIEDMIAYISPEVNTYANVKTIQYGNKGSGSYTIEDFRDLTLLIEEELKTSDGVVVTTGTDTMEEFAYWFDLTVHSKKPVVLTGAMRPWGNANGDVTIGGDGPINLLNSIKLAASQKTYCYGSVLMLNDEIHAARDVSKKSTYRTDTFQSGEYGVLGYIDGDNINVERAPARVANCDDENWFTPFDLSEVTAKALPRVEIAFTYQAAGGEVIDAFAAAGVKGIVTAGTGAGGTSAAQSVARKKAAEEGVVFASTSRTGSGEVYGGSGNIIAAGDLLPQKARLLLLLSLTFSDDVEEIRGWFNTIGNPSFDKNK
jgi:L-asparaginase